MNYYEELGVSEQATEQEIRKAHRRLVKLMHPDAQPDPQLKVMAETQMRRLNSIVSTLLDPEQRGTYDKELVAAQSPERGAPSSSWQGIPWWLASMVAAVVLTLVAVWLWADHLGANFGNKPAQTVYIPSLDMHPPAAASPKSGSRTSGSPDDATVSSNYKAQDSGADMSRSVSNQANDRGGISAAVISDAPVVVAPAKERVLPEIKPSSTVAAAKRFDEDIRKDKHREPLPVKKVVVAAPAKREPEKPRLMSARKEPQTRTTAGAAPHSESHDKLNGNLVSIGTPARKVFAMPSGSLVASAAPVRGGHSQMPVPPGVTPQAGGHDFNSIPGSSLPAAGPPPQAVDVTTSTSAAPGRTSAIDPLEGEWVYAPKEPERRRAGFYPPEFIDLKLFGAGDTGNLRGQYNAKYLVTDKPVAPEVSFDLASLTKGSRKFVWQSSSGAKGTLSIDPIDERTIRIDWHTTTSTRAPALTSGQATLVRRQ